MHTRAEGNWARGPLIPGVLFLLVAGALILFGIVQVRQARRSGADLSRSAGASRLGVPTNPPDNLIKPSLSVGGLPGKILAPSGIATNVFDRFPSLAAGSPRRLFAADLENYLRSKGRSVESLLAAYRITGESSFLSDAVQKSPSHPQVALDAVLRKDLKPGEHLYWLETFKKSDPLNALPDYLSALDHLRRGKPELAFQDLLAASGKPQFEDYSGEAIQEVEQAYLLTGYTPAEAKAIRLLQEVTIAQTGGTEEAENIAPLQARKTLEELKALAVNLSELGKSYKKAGDFASANSALQLAVQLGQRYTKGNGDGFAQLVGTAAELMALSAMDANGTLPGDPQRTVQDRVTELKAQRKAVRSLYQQAGPLLGMMSEQDWSEYSERARTFGEPAALQWVVGKYGEGR